MNIPIRALLALRGQVQDITLLDYITLAHLTPEPGAVATKALRERWGCTQPQVSRRVNAVARAGLADITAGGGAYQVHAVKQLEMPHG